MWHHYDRFSKTTLEQGLETFYAQHESQLSHTKEGLPIDVQRFFKSHDIAHVLFGCDISLYGEGTVKVWTIFGTTLGFWAHIKEYKKADAFELAQHFSAAEVLKDFFTLILAIPRLIFRAKNMKQPWPWTDFEPHLDRPIEEIRAEFNIQILSKTLKK